MKQSKIRNETDKWEKKLINKWENKEVNKQLNRYINKYEEAFYSGKITATQY